LRQTVLLSNSLGVFLDPNSPWWWQCLIEGGKVKGGQSSGTSHADQNEIPIIFAEEILKEEHSDPALADVERILALYRSDREDLRAVIPPILQSSGLLLSLSLGAIYFILKDGHWIVVNFELIVPMLIVIALLLGGAILSGVWALYKKPSIEGVTKKDLMEYERRSRAKDHFWGGISVGIMIIAVLGIVAMLALFWSESGRLNIASNSSGDMGPTVVVLFVGPNLSNVSNGLCLNDPDCKPLLDVGFADHESNIMTLQQKVKQALKSI